MPELAAFAALNMSVKLQRTFLQCVDPHGAPSALVDRASLFLERGTNDSVQLLEVDKTSFGKNIFSWKHWGLK